MTKLFACQVSAMWINLKIHVHCQHGLPSTFNASMNEHRHSLERSREIAPSTIALHLVTTEVAKGYAPAQVLNALRGNGTPKGSTRLIGVDGGCI